MLLECGKVGDAMPSLGRSHRNGPIVRYPLPIGVVSGCRIVVVNRTAHERVVRRGFDSPRDRLPAVRGFFCWIVRAGGGADGRGPALQPLSRAPILRGLDRRRRGAGRRRRPAAGALLSCLSSTTSTTRSSATPMRARSSRAGRPRSSGSRGLSCSGSATSWAGRTMPTTSPDAGESAGGTSRSAWTRSTPTSRCPGCEPA